MTTSLDDLLPKAEDCMKKIAEVEAEKASEYMRKQQAAEAEKRDLMDKLSQAVGRLGRGAHEARRGHHQARGRQRPDRGRGRHVSRTSSAPTAAAPSTSRSRAGRRR